MGLYKQSDVAGLFKSNQQLADSVYVLVKRIEATQAELSDADYRLVVGNIAGEPIPAAEVGEVFQRLTLLLQGHNPDEQREAETAFACERCGGFNVQVIKVAQSGKGIGICDDCGENQVVPGDMVGVCPRCGQDVALTGDQWT